MKRVLFFIIFITLGLNLSSKDNDTTKVEKLPKDIVKTGYNFGPCPVIGFDADKGFGMGALCNIYNFKDGSTYPNPNQQWYLEGSYYTKGTHMYIVSVDALDLIPNIRTSISALCIIDNALNFSGFNGYQTFYDYERMDLGNTDNSVSFFNPYYRVGRTWANLKADFTGDITENGRLKWRLGYHFSWDKYEDMDIKRFNSNLEENKKYDINAPTLFGQYKEWGIIPEEIQDGGITSSIRAALVYDSRDIENNPAKGIWAEAHIIASPKLLGSTQGYYKYSLNFRHYIPIIYKELTFAYRLMYQGTLGKELPFYAMPYLNVTGIGYDRDAIGGYRTVRGMMRNRINALDMGFYNAELRWKFVEFKLWKQNIAFALSAFSDGGISTRNYDISFNGNPDNFEDETAFAASKAKYEEYISKGDKQDSFHITTGGGLRFIMNSNFIIAAETGVPLDPRDGGFSFYLGTGFLF